MPTSLPADTHPVRGVLVAVPGLLAGVVVGLMPGAVVAVVVRSSNPTFNATVLVASALVGLALSALALSRWAVPRVAGTAYRHAPRALVLRIMAAATVACSLLLAAPGLGGSWRAIALWLVGSLVAGAVGSLVGASETALRSRGDTSLTGLFSRRRLHHEEGALAAEHIAVVLLVGAVVAALVNLALPGILSQWAQYASCELFGDDGSCVEPAAFDPGPCVASTDSDDLHVEGSFVVSVDRDLGYKTEQLSDGTVVVTYNNGAKVGTGVGAGLSVQLFAGEASSKAGAEAQASIKATFQEGQAWEFTGPDAREDAANWVEWHTVNAGAADLAAPGGRDGLLGQAWDTGTTAVNGLLNLGPLDLGMDVPDEPDQGSIYVAGGIEGSASAFAGVTGEDTSDGQGGGLSADVEAALTKAMGFRMHSDGRTTAYIDATSLLAADGTAITSVGGIQLGDGSTIAITLDANGQPTEATVTTRRLDEPGLQLAGNPDTSAAFGDATYASGSADGLPTAPSLYETTAALDLTEDADAQAMASLLGGTLTQSVGPVRDAALEQFYASADITTAEYEVDEERWGGIVNAEAVAKAGGGLTVGSSSSQVQNAHYYDPATGTYEVWEACLAGAS